MRTRVISRGLLLPLSFLWLIAPAPSSAQGTGWTSEWTSQDVGDPVLAGRTDASTDGIRISAAGHDIWGTFDEFHFAYRQVSGDIDIRVRVDRLSHIDDWTKAGVMIRESLSSGARHAFVLASAASGLAFQLRPATGGDTWYIAGSGGAAPVWLRLVRTGNVFSAYSSSDGGSWILLSTAVLDISSTAYVGLAVTSHSQWQMAEATFSGLQLQTSTSSGGSTGTSDSSWTGMDVGDPALIGSFSSSADTVTVVGAGYDIWNDWDQFQFVYQAVTGDLDLIARVASQQNTDPWAKAGVMIRETLTGSSAHASMFATPANGWAFQHRPWNWAQSSHAAGGTGSAPGWVRLTRTGDLFTAFRSSDGTSWHQVGNATIPMAATVYVGLAVTSHAVWQQSTAVFDSVRIGGSPVSDGSSGSSDPPAEDPASGDSSPPPESPPAEDLSTPISLVFLPSTDHATNVDAYVLELRRAGDPLTVSPVVTRNLGKPAIVGGEISVDITSVVDALASGSYYAAVFATGPGGNSTRAVSAEFVK